MLGAELVNCAISGNTTGGMLAQLERQLERTRPAAVLLMGGFNDILLSGTDTAARSNLGAMGHITAGWGAVPVFGTPPLPCPPIQVKWNGLAELEQVGEQTAELQGWIRRMCGVFGYPLLELQQELVRLASKEGKPLRSYFLDGLHMNAAGHRAIAELAAPALRGILSGSV